MKTNLIQYVSPLVKDRFYLIGEEARDSADLIQSQSLRNNNWGTTITINMPLVVFFFCKTFFLIKKNLSPRVFGGLWI